MDKQLVIIIEGCNKSGKTTLVNYIKEWFPEKLFEVIKCSQPKNGDAFNEYRNILEWIKKNPNKNYIIDRFHFGSFVYGPIYRGENDFSLDKFVEIELMIEELNYLFILAIANKSFIKKKFIEEKEEFAKIELIDEEIKFFNDIKKKSRLNITNHNIPKNDLTKNNEIINLIKMYE